MLEDLSSEDLGEMSSIDAISPIELRETTPLKIFISYRSDPDYPLAAALKKFIESAIDPQPDVFVAGGGGLRPSNIGFKGQLQDAAKRAHAFVAIITNASKDREWIFFEAGAAWGRDLMYVPVLVGSRPEDLPSTIGDYQALNGQSRDDMLRLIRVLSGVTGAGVRERLGQRYLALSKAIDQYLQGGAGEGEGDSGFTKELMQAFTVAAQGDPVRSKPMFDVLVEKASDNEEKCIVRILQARAEQKERGFFRALERFDDSLKRTSRFNLMMAIESERPLAKAKFLSRAIEIGVGEAALQARLLLARLNFDSGRRDLAVSELLTLMADEVAGKYSEQAAALLIEYCQAWQPIVRLLVYLASFSGEDVGGYRWIADLAAENHWNALYLYCSERSDALDGTGLSANARGLSREGANFRSLAFESYSRSASLGVSVAKYNMANLVFRQGNTSAALSILREGSESADAADPGYPHELRAEIERALHRERERERENIVLGKRQFHALWTIAGKGLSLRGKVSSRPEGRLQFSGGAVIIRGGKMLYEKDLTTVTILPVEIFQGNLVVLGIPEFTAFVTVSGDSLEGFGFRDFSEAAGLEWLEWIPIPRAELVEGLDDLEVIP